MPAFRTFKLISLLFFLGIFARPASSQQLIIGAGITPFSPAYSFSSLRLKVGVPNLINRFGVYGMWELNPYNSYGRDAIGVNFQVNCIFRIWAGIGVFEKGLINPQNKVNIWNGIRKEMGVGYISRYKPIQWELGYSFTLGPTFQFYYEIPLVKKDRNGDGKYSNVDRSLPCVLEWQKRDTTVEIVYDTIWIGPIPSQPICANPLPIDSFNQLTATNRTFELPMAYEKDQVMLNGNLRERIKYYLVGILKENPELIVEIGSHTECDGRAEFNQQLTQRRADTIRNHLITTWGASPEKVIAIGYGESVPVNLCNCEGSDVVGYTPFIDTVTRKQIPNFSKDGKLMGYIFVNYESYEIDSFNGKPYVKCDIYQKEQNNRITLRFKKKLKHFKNIVDTCNRPINPLTKLKNCRDNFKMGSVPYSKLDTTTFNLGIFDLPVKYDRTSAMLSDRNKEILDSFANYFLKPHPQFVLELGGHTDCRQTLKYNLELSKKRVDQIKEYLTSTHKIDPERIVTNGYGETHILNECSCEGSEISPFTPYISGVTKKLELEFDARGSIFGEKLEDYTPREIRIVEGNPFVACNDKQHRQNERITMRIDTSYYNICIDKVYKKKEPIPEPEEIHLDEGLGIEWFNIENAFNQIFTLPIFYDLDKAVIRPDAQKVLDSFAIKVMFKYPFLICELGSHTDCRMPYDYNERLAQRRADSAVDYLRKRWNLGPNRIIAKGYGETQLVNECHCEDELKVDYTPYIPGRTAKMIVDLDDDGKVIGTIYQDYDSTEITYFGEMPFVKCEEYQHRQNRRTTVRFTNDPKKFGIIVDQDRDKNNTNVGQSQYFERMKKGGLGHIKENVDEFKTNFTDIANFNIKDAMEKAYALPIYYDLDKAEIRPDAQRVLDSFVINIMQKYPQLVVELGSHTDCRMPYDYNVRLSKRRADSAVDYIIKTWKIDPKKIVAVGYGEHQTVNECACEDENSTSYTPYIPGRTKKMLVDLDDDGNVIGAIYQEYEPKDLMYIEGKPMVKCEEYQHRQNRRTTVRFANDPRDFGLEIDVDIDHNNINKRE